jgi:hypothetical protein
MTLEDAMNAVNMRGGQPLMPDDFESEVQRWMQHKGTPPFVSSPAWEEAQRRKMAGIANPFIKLFLRNIQNQQQQSQQMTLRDYSQNPYAVGGANPFRY